MLVNTDNTVLSLVNLNTDNTVLSLVNTDNTVLFWSTLIILYSHWSILILLSSHWSIPIILSSHWSMQCLKSVRAAVTDCKEVWINDDTFTAEEVEEIIKAVDEAVKGEVESELLNTR